MRTCGNCGTENPEQARFCIACGTPLEAAGEERRLITAVFTEVADLQRRVEPGADPEDLSALLRPVHELLRRHIEGFGGSGINQIGGVDSVFYANTAADNGEYGFAAFSSNGTKMAFNTATGSEEAAFYVGDSHPADAALWANRAYGNALGYFVRNAEDERRDGEPWQVDALRRHAPEPAEVHARAVQIHARLLPGLAHGGLEQ